MFRINRATWLMGLSIIICASLLFISSTRPAECSQQDPQCEVLKERITKPRNAEEKNKRNYYCEQMKDRKCSQYENLCQSDSGRKSLDDFAGTWQNEVTDDAEFKEKWTITIERWMLYVEGHYYDRESGKERGKFKRTEIGNDGETGELGFVQVFDPKPDPNWADTNRIREIKVSGDTLTFKHQYGEHELYREK
jgi:hypothetical protein